MPTRSFNSSGRAINTNGSHRTSKKPSKRRKQNSQSRGGRNESTSSNWVRKVPQEFATRHKELRLSKNEEQFLSRSADFIELLLTKVKQLEVENKKLRVDNNSLRRAVKRYKNAVQPKQGGGRADAISPSRRKVK